MAEMVLSVRPRRAILVAPAVAKEEARLDPRPPPPPVIRTTFPATESSGRSGEIEGYAVLWCNFVTVGKLILGCLFKEDK